MNKKARMTGIESTTRSIRNANTPAASARRETNSGLQQGIEGMRLKLAAPPLRQAPPVLPEPLSDMNHSSRTVPLPPQEMVKW